MSTLFNNLTNSVPRPLPGATFWTDGSITPAGAVASWTDLTGVSGAATQSGSGKPVSTVNQQNGKSALVFTGASSQTLVLPSALYTLSNGPSTIFIAGKRSSASGAIENMFSLAVVGTGTNRTVMRFDASEQLTGFNCLAGSTVSQACTTTNFSIHRFRRSGTTQAVSVNNATEATTTAATDETGIDDGHIGSKLGSSQFITGIIGEIIIYPFSMSATQMNYMERVYLGPKWAVSVS